MTAVRNAKGFTLIELAIVLVIIGIIIGAVLKGQDLIENARHKKFANTVKQFEVITWGFMDRKGFFPGDGDKDGLIGEQSTDDPQDDIKNKGRFLDPPSSNSITLGSYTFYVWFGNDGSKNIIAVTKSNAASPTAFEDAELAYLEAFDTSIDGAADGTGGRVKGSIGIGVNSATWRISTVPSSVSDAWSTTVTALVYYFDRK